mmetsp:Transcript_58495/g.97072  ORF Transcript_58495/g.97072 Transcript_58495/m.97072 type:complete len:283 (-) Transcript_58495:493-1341(-)
MLLQHSGQNGDCALPRFLFCMKAQQCDIVQEAEPDGLGLLRVEDCGVGIGRAGDGRGHDREIIHGIGVDCAVATAEGIQSVHGFAQHKALGQVRERLLEDGVQHLPPQPNHFGVAVASRHLQCPKHGRPATLQQHTLGEHNLFEASQNQVPHVGRGIGVSHDTVEGVQELRLELALNEIRAIQAFHNQLPQGVNGRPSDLGVASGTNLHEQICNATPNAHNPWPKVVSGHFHHLLQTVQPRMRIQDLFNTDLAQIAHESSKAVLLQVDTVCKDFVDGHVIDL